MICFGKEQIEEGAERMKIYMKDGLRMQIKAEKPELLEAEFGRHAGYVHIRLWEPDHKGSFVLMTISKENLIFIDYENANEAKVQMEFDDHWE